MNCAVQGNIESIGTLSALQISGFFAYQFFKINECITHTTEGGIDAAVANFCNFLEAQIAIVTKN